MAEEEIGKIAKFFGKINVAAIDLSGELCVGDTIRVKGHTTDFTETVASIQIEHQSVEKAGSGESVGIIVKERVRPGDKVYKVTRED